MRWMPALRLRQAFRTTADQRRASQLRYLACPASAGLPGSWAAAAKPFAAGADARPPCAGRLTSPPVAA